MPTPRGRCMVEETARKYVLAAGVEDWRVILWQIKTRTVRGAQRYPRLVYPVIDIQQELYRAGYKKLPPLRDFLTPSQRSREPK